MPQKEIISRIKEAFSNPKIWQFAISIVVFAVISLAFFHPDAIEGNTLQQQDMKQGQAIGEETRLYQEETGTKSWWTNSLFSGMPTFQISPTYSSNSLFDWLTSVYGLGLPSPSNLLFMMMLGFMIFMLSMNVKWYYSMIGAVAWGLSTYFIIIIGAGHIWKFVTLSYIPPTIAGIILAYRGRWLMGSALAALFAMMQISSNHVQMSYYFLFVIVAMVIAFFFDGARKKELGKWGKATISLAVAAILAVSANLPSLYNTYEYSKETIRGGHSELTAEEGSEANSTAGLDRDYITQYSYGRAETFSLIIPNIKGGASARPEKGQMVAMSLAQLPDAEKMKSEGQIGDAETMFLNYMSQYFGEPEGTNGPVYVGVLIFALFLVGCVVVKGPVKWSLLIMTIISILLALGRNCQWITDMFIDYIPMYSKFRTVESILVIAEFTIPALAILGLQRIMTSERPLERYWRTVAWCFGAVAIVCVAGIFMPGIFGDVVTAHDEQISLMIGQQLAAQGYPRDVVAMFSLDNPTLYQTVKSLREAVIESDSLRSLAFLAFGFMFLAFYGTGHLRRWIAVAGVGTLVFIDLYTVNKRYINHDSFIASSLEISDPFPMSAADRQILQDTAMNYRVMDIPGFFQAAPSFRHKAIGGYHAAKLTRYQDLIEHNLMPIVYGDTSAANMNVLNMLNAKYIIDRSGTPAVNPDALGNAWFVDKISYVDNADEEIAALQAVNPATEAVSDKKFKDILGSATEKNPGDTIFETSYAPDRLSYHFNSEKGGVATFSEVYFPYGWEAKVNGTPVEIGRVNYLLRAIRLPAGSGTLTMEFNPKSIKTTTAIASTAVWIIYAMVIFAIVNLLIHYSRKPEEDEQN